MKVKIKFVSEMIKSNLVLHSAIGVTYFFLVIISVVFSSLIYGGNTINKNGLNNYFENKTLIVEKQQNITLDKSKVQIQKLSRPSLSEVNSLFNYTKKGQIRYNFQAIQQIGSFSIFDLPINGFEIIYLDENTYKEESQLVEYLNKDLDYSNGVYINSAMLDELNKNVAIADLSKIQIDYKMEYLFEQNLAISTASYKVIGVVHEFSYMTTPKLYFSYKGVEEMLEKAYFNGDGSLLDYFTGLDDYNSLTSYSYILFFDNVEDVSSCHQIIKNIASDTSKIVTNSSYIILHSSFNALYDLLVIAVAFTGIIILTGVLFVLLFINRILISKSEKSIAVLLLLGIKEKQVKNLYLNIHSVSIVFIALPFLFINSVVTFLNSLINKQVGIADLMIDITKTSPFSSISIITIFALVLYLLTRYFINHFTNKIIKGNILGALSSND